MAVWMAETPLYTTATLGGTLFQFLTMASGRQFSDNGTATGWSRVIWDLIENGLKKGFTRKRTGHAPSPGSRMSGDPIPQYACYAMGFRRTTESIVDDMLGPSAKMLRNAGEDGSIPPDLPFQMEFDDPMGGISMIIIETDESELPEEFADS